MSVHATEAEAAVLGCVLLRPECIHAFELTPDEFDTAGYRAIWEAMVSLTYDRGVPIDAITVADEVRRLRGHGFKGLESELADLAARVPTAENVVWWAKMVRLSAIKRRVLLALSEQRAKVDATDLPGIVESVEHMQRSVIGACDVQGKFEAIAVVFDAMIARLEKDPSGQAARIKTDIRAIDGICGGFPYGHPTMVGGRPSNGKTLLMRTIADNIARRGIAVGYISLEDSPIDMVQWQALRRARIGIERIVQGKITDAEIRQLRDLRAEIAALPIAYCREAALTGAQICQRARQMIATTGIKVLFVDYLQLVKLAGDKNQAEEMGEVVQMLATVGHDNGIAVVIGSQLNRENEREKRRPQLSDFKGCGGIEEAAELAILVHRQWKMAPDPMKPRYAKLLEAAVAKMKLGEPGTAWLYFEGALGYACDPEPDYFTREMDGPVEFCSVNGCKRFALWGEKFCGRHKEPQTTYQTVDPPRDYHDTDREDA